MIETSFKNDSAVAAWLFGALLAGLSIWLTTGGMAPAQLDEPAAIPNIVGAIFCIVTAALLLLQSRVEVTVAGDTATFTERWLLYRRMTIVPVKQLGEPVLATLFGDDDADKTYGASIKLPDGRPIRFCQTRDLDALHAAVDRWQAATMSVTPPPPRPPSPRSPPY